MPYTLKNLQDLSGLYDEFTSIPDSQLPEYYKEIFPHTCICGSEIILTKDTETQNAFTQLQCSSPICWVKMAHKFAHFCKTLGYKGFGEASSLTLFSEIHQTFKYPTFLSVFKASYSQVLNANGPAYTEAFFELKQDLETRVVPFKDAIAALGIPGVGKNSALFNVVKDPLILLSCALKDELNMLCDLAGINAPKTRFNLSIARLDIVTMMTDVIKNIRSTPSNEVYIAITGSVSVDGLPLSRLEFIEKCEAILVDGRPAYKLVETKAASKLQYVIADFPSNSSKYQLGQQHNLLISANDFYHMLVDEAKGG